MIDTVYMKSVLRTYLCLPTKFVSNMSCLIQSYYSVIASRLASALLPFNVRQFEI